MIYEYVGKSIEVKFTERKYPKGVYLVVYSLYHFLMAVIVHPVQHLFPGHTDNGSFTITVVVNYHNLHFWAHENPKNRSCNMSLVFDWEQ